MKKSPLIPKNNSIIIKQTEAQERMYGNIMIPDTGKEAPMMGEVLAIGPGEYNMFHNIIIPINDIKVGDIVFYPSFGGTRISYENEEFIICKSGDILAALPPKEVKIDELISETTLTDEDKANLKENE